MARAAILHPATRARPDPATRHARRGGTPDAAGSGMLDPLIGLLVAVALAVYLVYALLRPERF
jgi:K+-transporting ATPase KdpF subunit